MSEEAISNALRARLVQALREDSQRRGGPIEVWIDLEAYLKDWGLWDDSFMVAATRPHLI
jgi:hypothetical protein